MGMRKCEGGSGNWMIVYGRDLSVKEMKVERKEWYVNHTQTDRQVGGGSS